MRLATFPLLLSALCWSVAPPASAQTSTVVDDFEWAAGIDPSAYEQAALDHGWEARDATGVDMPITITTDAQQGDYALSITQNRQADDYFILNLEGLNAQNGEDTPVDWSQWDYVSFWVKSSAAFEGDDSVFEIRPRDADQDWTRYDPISVGTDWQYVVFKLPSDDFSDALRYVRFYLDSRKVSVPLTLSLDDVQLHTADPRGPSELLEDFSWAGFSVGAPYVADSLISHDWKPRVRNADENGNYTNINPRISLIEESDGNYAIQLTPNREDQDYVILEFEEDTNDDGDADTYADWSQYRYLSFWVRGDSTWSDRSPFKVQVRDATTDWLKFDPDYVTPGTDGDPMRTDTLGTLTGDWRMVVLDLNEGSSGTRTALDRQQVRYVRFDVYTNADKPKEYNVYLDNLMVSAWDPRNPSPADQTVAVEGAVPGTEAFTFEPGAPNPFRTATALRFTLDRSSEVTLEVFDLLGRRVATLAQSEPFAAGAHSLRWDVAGTDLPSGHYLARLSVDGARSTQKLMVLR